MKENKKEILDSSIMFPAEYYRKNINIFNEKLTNRLFSLQCDAENFIFSLRYRQKVACFRYNTTDTISSLRTAIVYENFMFRQGKRICGKMPLSYVFVRKKVQKIGSFRETETYAN